MVTMMVFESLVYLGTDQKIYPGLAESWVVADDGKTLTFKLRRGVKFHDGTELKADAVKFHFDRCADPATKSKLAASLLGPYDSTEVVDDYTVLVNTTAPYPIFTERLQNFQMISEKVAEQGDEYLALNPIGTGPYKFVEWKPAEGLKLTANTEYWNPDVTIAYSDLDLRVIPGIPTQLAELLAETVFFLSRTERDRKADRLARTLNDDRYRLVRPDGHDTNDVFEAGDRLTVDRDNPITDVHASRRSRACGLDLRRDRRRRRTTERHEKTGKNQDR